MGIPSGLDGRALLEAAGGAAAEERYRATARVAHARGVFGSPSWMVGDALFRGAARGQLVRCLETC